MIITCKNSIIKMRVSFAGIECEIIDSMDFFRKVERFAERYKNLERMTLTAQIDTVKGTTSVFDELDVMPMFTVRTSMLFEKECSLTRLINLFAVGKKIIRFS